MNAAKQNKKISFPFLSASSPAPSARASSHLSDSLSIAAPHEYIRHPAKTRSVATMFLRRRRDSNSRDRFRSAAFPRRCTRPLCDASVSLCYNRQTFYFPSSSLMRSEMGGCVENIRPIHPPMPLGFAPKGSPMKRCAVAVLALFMGAV